MCDAELERTQISIESESHSYIFNAKGEVITFDGFLKLYMEGVDDESEKEDSILPKVNVGEELSLVNMISTERFSRPPFRYSEASLVKKMEELGIGRPSTYAPTITTIQNRNYVEKGSYLGEERNYDQLILKDGKIQVHNLKEKVGADKGKLVPTDIGMIVNDFLVENFETILDFNFTAEVEQNFDNIARGVRDWKEMLKNFTINFILLLNMLKKTQNVSLVREYLGLTLHQVDP